MLPDKNLGVILLGTSILACLAGYFNGFAVVVMKHGVSHVTGTTSKLAEQVVLSNQDGLLENSFLILSFCFGSFLCGLMIESQGFNISYKYQVAIGFEACLVAAAGFLLDPSYSLWAMRMGEYCLSCACGLQNALVTTYSKAIIRTTHMTGIVSDIGAIIGQIARKDFVNAWKLKIFFPIYVSFFFGSAAGAAAAMRFEPYGLYVPAAILAAVSFGYTLYRAHLLALRHFQERRARKRAMLAHSLSAPEFVVSSADESGSPVAAPIHADAAVQDPSGHVVVIHREVAVPFGTAGGPAGSGLSRPSKELLRRSMDGRQPREVQITVDPRRQQHDPPSASDGNDRQNANPRESALQTLL